MPVKIQDVLNANLVLLGVGLLNEQEEFNAFRQAVDTEVTSSSAGLIGSISVLQPNIMEPERTITLNRDRISLSLSSIRSTIAHDYPSPQSIHRLAEVAAQAIASTDFGNRQLQAKGYNLALVYEPDSGSPALKYIADRLLRPPVSVQDKWKLAAEPPTDFRRRDEQLDFQLGTST